ECLLADVERVVVIANDAQRDCERLLLMSLHQYSERRPVAALRQFDELPLRMCMVAHSILHGCNPLAIANPLIFKGVCAKSRCVLSPGPARTPHSKLAR